MHTNRIASKEPVDLTNTTDVSGDSGETKKTLIQVHGLCDYDTIFATDIQLLIVSLPIMYTVSQKTSTFLFFK